MAGKRSTRLSVTLAGVLTFCGVARIVATYDVFSQTWDEPAHIAAGLEWIDRGTYTFEPLHPPLARIMTALGPYWMGERLSAESNIWREGNRVLGIGTHYGRTLAGARAGILPFFVIACVCVFFLGRRVGGAWVAVVSMFFFTTLPPVLAHAGLATTDMPATAALIGAVCAFLFWLEAPTIRRGLLLGVALGSAVATKLSILLFLPLALASTWFLLRHKHLKNPPSRMLGSRSAINRGRPILLGAILTLWAAYRFSVGPILPAGSTAACPAEAPNCTPSRAVRVAVSALQASVYPAPEFFKGLLMLANEARKGRKGYYLGRLTDSGGWLYFPFAIAVKTPLPFLVLTGLGASALLAGGSHANRRVQAVPFVAAMTVLVVCMPSRITIGLRHILPIYPLLSVTAAYGGFVLWGWRRAWIGPTLLTMSLAWQLLCSLRAHPDYLAYFNEVARGDPEHYLVDSDLDWGQDLKRLATFVHNCDIRALKLAYHGTADPKAVGLNDYTPLAPYEHATGWIAASVYALKLGSARRPTTDDYAWLEALHPVTRVGRSILVYRLSDAADRNAGRSAARVTPPRQTCWISTSGETVPSRNASP